MDELYTGIWSTSGWVPVGLLEVRVDVVDVDDGEVEAVVQWVRVHQWNTTRAEILI
jgi:hypothetical protein